MNRPFFIAIVDFRRVSPYSTCALLGDGLLAKPSVVVFRDYEPTSAAVPINYQSAYSILKYEDEVLLLQAW